MLRTKMCNDQIYVIHEYEMCFIRTDVTYENVIQLIPESVDFSYLGVIQNCIKIDKF